LQTVEELGLEENTIVMFSSDNGPWLAFRTHGGSAGPLRAGKGTTFEGGQRVPTIFWGPGYVKPGMVTEMGSTLDVMNTFAAIAGAEIPSDRKMDGFDLTPVLTGSGSSPRTAFHYWTRGVLHAVRSGNWKLHIRQRDPVHYGGSKELDTAELYNLEADISEKYDRAKDHPDVVASLQEMLAKHQADMADVLPDNLAERIENDQE